MSPESTMVVPAVITADLPSFTPWNEARKLIGNNVTWMPRSEAEDDHQWRQLIPSAILTDGQGRYYTFRRIPNKRRPELSDKTSLIIGGHPTDRDRRRTVGRSLRASLRRELAEETNVTIPLRADPLGVAIDQTNQKTAQHIAIIYVVTAPHPVTAQADEEFVQQPSHNGRLQGVEELKHERHLMDPWSTIMIPILS